MLSENSLQVLQELRKNVESTFEQSGKTFGSVYLENCNLPGISPSQFAGHLSALSTKGFYIPLDKFFGNVLLGPLTEHTP
jgi:hypothetical protein